LDPKSLPYFEGATGAQVADGHSLVADSAGRATSRWGDEAHGGSPIAINVYNG